MKLKSLFICLIFMFVLSSISFAQGIGDGGANPYKAIEDELVVVENQIAQMIGSGKLQKDSEDSKKIIAILDEIQGLLLGNDPNALASKVEDLQNTLANVGSGSDTATDVAPEVTTGETPTLPKYYVVKKREPLTDCLWRIAGYSFIYGDANQWREIYNANQSIIRNADFIYPGQVLEIPSLNGEVREGTYDEDQL